jgi:hypothetical protein
MLLEKDTSTEDDPPPRSAPSSVSTHSSAVLEGGGQSRLTTLETELESLRAENRELREQMESVLLDLSHLQSAFEDLRRDLGG